MLQTDKGNGFVELSVSDGANILHRVGSTEYPEMRRMTVRAEDVDVWEEIGRPAYTKAEYDAKVAELIRARYSADEEFALHRKAINAAFTPSVTDADAKAMDEYREYNDYAEECKRRARAVVTEGSRQTDN